MIRTWRSLVSRSLSSRFKSLHMLVCSCPKENIDQCFCLVLQLKCYFDSLSSELSRHTRIAIERVNSSQWLFNFVSELHCEKCLELIFCTCCDCVGTHRMKKAFFSWSFERLDLQPSSLRTRETYLVGCHLRDLCGGQQTKGTPLSSENVRL